MVRRRVDLEGVFQATTSTELANGDVLFERHEVVDNWDASA